MRNHARRLAAAATLGAMLGTLAGLPSAEAAISTQAFCANVQPGQSGFSDIGSVAAAQRQDIECLQATGITSGTTATTYSPTAGVARGAMATFVANLVDTANALELTTLAALPPNPPDAFTDDEGNVHESNIDQLAAADIVQGKTATTFAPADPVNRGQMATFLVEALEYLRNSPLPAGSNAFTDDTGNVHEASINKLANIDVVDGVGGSAYSPNTTVSRAQMASFLIRSLAYLHSQGQISAVSPSRQTIVLTPSGNVTNETDNAAGGEVAFTASNITVSDVDIALIPCENAFVVNGRLGFVDAAPNDGVADPGADLVEADIVAVNGTAQPANTESVTGAVVTNGAVTFTVDSPTPDCVVAVVWDDADDDDGLDLDGTDRPSERFGATTVQFVAPAAASGAMDENVLSNDEANNQFTGCELGPASGLPGAGPAPEQGPNAPTLTDCFRFTYDANDRFGIDANSDLMLGANEQVTLAQFEAALTENDDMSGTYDADPGDQSTFLLVDEAPAAPGNVSAAPVDGDTISVTFDEVAVADSYRIYQNQDTGPLGCPTFTTTGADPYTLAGTLAGGLADRDAGTTNTFFVNGLTPSTRYCFVVTSVDDGDEGGPSTAANATTNATVDSAAPVAKDTDLDNRGTDPAVVDTGDQILICFDEDIANPDTDAPPLGDTESLTLQDNNGTVATLTQGANANFDRATTDEPRVEAPGAASCPANRTLIVVLTGNPATTSGPADGVAVGASITLASEIEDVNGNQFAPDGDDDVVVDVENDEPA